MALIGAALGAMAAVELLVPIYEQHLAGRPSAGQRLGPPLQVGWLCKYASPYWSGGAVGTWVAFAAICMIYYYYFYY